MMLQLADHGPVSASSLPRTCQWYVPRASAEAGLALPFAPFAMLDAVNVVTTEPPAATQVWAAAMATVQSSNSSVPVSIELGSLNVAVSSGVVSAVPLAVAGVTCVG